MGRKTKPIEEKRQSLSVSVSPEQLKAIDSAISSVARFVVKNIEMSQEEEEGILKGFNRSFLMREVIEFMTDPKGVMLLQREIVNGLLQEGFKPRTNEQVELFNQ